MKNIWSALSATIVLTILGGCSPAGTEAKETEAKPTIHGVYEDNMGGADDQVVPGEIMSGPEMAPSMSLTLGEDGTVSVTVSMRGSEQTQQGTWDVEAGTLLALDLDGGGPAEPGYLLSVWKDDSLKMSTPDGMLVSLRKSAESAESAEPGLPGVYTLATSEMSEPVTPGALVLRLEVGGRATLEMSRGPGSEPRQISGDWTVEEGVPVVITIDDYPAIFKYADDALTIQGPMGRPMVVHKREPATTEETADLAPEAGAEPATDVASKPAPAGPTQPASAPKPAVTPHIQRRGVEPNIGGSATGAALKGPPPDSGEMRLQDVMYLTGWSVRTIDLPAGLAPGDELFLEFVKETGVVYRSSILQDQKPWSGPPGARALKLVLDKGSEFWRADSDAVPRLHCILIGEDWIRSWQCDLPGTFDYESFPRLMLHGDNPTALGSLFGMFGAGANRGYVMATDEPRGDDVFIRVVRGKRAENEPSAGAEVSGSSAQTSRSAVDVELTIADVGCILGREVPLRDMDSVEAALNIDCITLSIERAVPGGAELVLEMVRADAVTVVGSLRRCYANRGEPDIYWGSAKLLLPTKASSDERPLHSIFSGGTWISPGRIISLPGDIEFTSVDATSVALGQPFAIAISGSADAPSEAPFLRAVLKLPSKPAVDANVEAWALVDPDRADKTTDVAHALVMTREALANAPGYLPLRETYAWALFANGRFDEALAELAKAKEMGPTDDARRYDGVQIRMRSLIRAARGR